MRNRIRQLREERGWTPSDLAAVLDVSRQTVSALEAGRWDPSLSLAFTIAAEFESSIEDLFTPERPHRTASPAG